MIERLFIDDRRNFTRQSARACVFVKDNDLICLAYRLHDGFAIKRRDRSQVQDFEIDPLLAQDFSRFKGDVHHRSISNDAEITPFPREPRFPERHNIIVSGNFFFDPAIEILMFEKNNRVVVANGGFNQPFGIVCACRTDCFQARRVDEPHLRILRMERAAVNITTARAANNQRSRRSPTIMSLRDHVDNLVEGTANEIHKLKLGDRTHAGERRPEGCTHDRGLSNWGIYDALRAKAIDETVSDFEGPTVDTNVLANAEHSGILLHFLPNSLADGLKISELHRYGLGPVDERVILHRRKGRSQRKCANE